MRDLSEYRVLIVDDVKENVDALVNVLQGSYKLSVALTGEAALKTAEKTQPDLVLLDVMLPGIDGFEVCQRLRQNPGFRDVPVMFLTGLQDVTNKTRGFEVGGNDYLTKPFESLEVRARVKAHLTAKAYADAAKERIASEMQIAREIQTGILPTDIERSVRGLGMEVGVLLEPAREVGGDLYLVLRNKERVVVCVGDVSGKGVPAALFMAVTTTLLRTVGRMLDTPEAILNHVNDELVEQNPLGMFVTLSCAIIDPARGTLSYASAGHPSPVLLKPGKRPTLPFQSTGMMAGPMPNQMYTGETCVFDPGDMLLFYTDGVTEAFNGNGEQYGEHRLVEAVRTSSFLSCEHLVRGVQQSVAAYASGQEQSDDLTLLAIRATARGHT